MLKRLRLCSTPGPFSLIPLLVFSLAIFARLLPGPRTIDDSYITFRYARNILAGNGFVYNPGEHVLGTTTPFYTGLMVLAGALAGGPQADFPALAWGLNMLADAVSCLFLIALGRRLGQQYAGLSAAFVWAVAPYSVTFAIGGLETSLYVLLLLGICYFHLEKKRRSVAFLAALMLLTRPDALILLGPLALDRIWQFFKARRCPPVNDPSTQENYPGLLIEGLLFSVPTLAWAAFAIWYFGSPLPHSIAAKSLAYQLPANAALIRLLQHYATPFQDHLTFGIPAIIVGVVLYPFLFAIGGIGLWKEETHSWPLIIYPWTYFFVFAIANPLIFRWYLTPPLPIYCLIILCGANDVIKQVYYKVLRFKPEQTNHPDSTLPERNPWGFRAIYGLLIFLVPFALSLRDWQMLPTHGLERPAPSMAWYQLELLYRQASEILTSQPDHKPASMLAAGDVGVLGYFTDMRILDTVGLNSPQSTKYYPLDPSYYAINYAVPPRLIIDMKPDFVTILEVYGRNGLLSDQDFLEQYQLIKKIPTDIYGSDGMLIFARR